MELDSVEHNAMHFLQLTERLLDAAEKGHWEEFVILQKERLGTMSALEESVGDQLLSWFPKLRRSLEQALEQNQRARMLAQHYRDSLGQQLLSDQQHAKVQGCYSSY